VNLSMVFLSDSDARVRRAMRGDQRNGGAYQARTGGAREWNASVSGGRTPQVVAPATSQEAGAPRKKACWGEPRAPASWANARHWLQLWSWAKADERSSAPWPAPACCRA